MTAFRRAADIDRELAIVLAEINKTIPPTMTLDDAKASRANPPLLQDLIAGRPITHTERIIPGPPGAADLVISIFKRADHRPGGPGIYHIHGGGMVAGHRLTGMEIILDWVELADAVTVTVEYRLAPEHPDPAPVEDCYAGLVWTVNHAQELGLNPERMLIVGASAGGGLAAGVSLLARDRGEPPLVGQILICPMLDDRNQTISSLQMDGIGIWDRRSNEMGWKALLGDRYKTDHVSIYAAPGRATDLSNLPPAFIDVGSNEVFRDECVAYASKIWECGGQAELHVWPGAFHGFNYLAPTSALAVAANTACTQWVRRILGD